MTTLRSFLFAGILMLFMLSTNVCAQVAESNLRQCDFSEVYRPEGWKIPGLAKAMPSGKRLSLQTSTRGVVSGVFVTQMKTNSIGTLFLPKCTQEPPGRLSLVSVPVKVLHLDKVDFHGSVFAYVVDYEPQFRESDGFSGTLGYVALVFLDTDGTGRFTVMRYNYEVRKSFLLSPEVPEWARRASSGRR